MATNILSPRSSGEGAVLSSPQSRRSRGVSSPWTQIVRGADSEPVVSAGGDTVAAAAPSYPSGSVSEHIASSSSDWPTSKPPALATSPSWSVEDDSAAEAPPEGSDNGNAAKKQAWKKPSKGNGNGGTAVEVSPVMDTALWPALSACTKASPKSASSDSLKALSEGSLLPSQGSGIASLSSNKPVIANNANPNPTPNHVTTTRQKSMKRGSTNGGFIQPSPPPPPPQSQVPAVEMPPGKPGNTTGESSHKEGGPRGGFGSDHQPQRSNSFNRRGSGGQHPRGEGSYHHNYGGRRDQDRGNQDWNNPHRNFGSRDNHMQPQRVAPRGFARGPHTSPAFIPPPPVPVRPFGNPMVYPEVPPSLIYVPGQPPESVRGVPIMAPAHPLYFPPVPDPQLHAKIVNQIDYYFSNDNLIKDTFLRQNMDDQGWVPIKLIAGFKKVMHLTDNIQVIVNAVQASTVVEVQNDKIRKRNDWMKWIMPPGPFSPVSSPQSLARSSHDMLAGQFQGVTLDEKTMHGHTEMYSRSSSEEFNSQLQQSGGKGTVQAGFERKTLAGSPGK